MKRFIFLVILLLVSISITDGIVDKEVEVTIEYKLVIDYYDQLHDTIPLEALRYKSSKNIEYWKDSTIHHIASSEYTLRTIKITSYKILTKN